jgi:thioredoxin reductase (NADPH)
LGQIASRGQQQTSINDKALRRLATASMINAADLQDVPLFAKLSEAMLRRIAARSADIRLDPGEWFSQEGDIPSFWVLLEGEAEAMKFSSGQQHRATTFDCGEYFGEVPLLLGSRTFVGMRALTASRLLRLDDRDFHALVSESAELAAELAQTLVRRVAYINEHSGTTNDVQATVIGGRHDIASHRIRDFLARNHIAYTSLDPEANVDSAYIPAQVRKAGTFPVVLLTDGRRLEAPTSRDLATALGLATNASGGTYDVVIIGGGPAGLSSAVYGGSEGLRTLLVEREATGGQAGTSTRIENYLGFPGGVTGDDLATRALAQAERFGTEILVTRNVKRIESQPTEHTVILEDGERIATRAVIVATGVSWRRLEISGADRLAGRGVFYGAARTEALTTRGQDVFLIGGGNSAGQAALHFSNYAANVTLLVRGERLEASMSHYLIEQLRTPSNISVETQTRAVALGGQTDLASITTQIDNGIPRTRRADALFAFIGADAHTSWLPIEMERDSRGYILTGHDLLRWPLLTRLPHAFESSIPGIFAVGDVRSGSVKRVASGVGEGSAVISFVHQHLEDLVRTTAFA